MDILLAPKLGGLAGILVLTIVFVYLPVYIFKRTGMGSWIHLANGFAAGVFLGAGLLHMLAESVETLEPFKVILGDEYPTPYLFAACGFIVVLFLENVVVRSQTDEVCVVGEHRHVSVNPTTTGADISINEEEISEKPEIAVDVGVEHHHHHRHRHPSVIDAPDHPWIPYLVAVVLSVHSLLAGLALGSTLTYQSAIILIVAILAHKWSEAFALGASFVRGNNMKKPMIISTAIYTLMTPIGIILGIVATTFVSSDIAHLLSGIFSSIASGTFLYIATTELLPEVFEHTTQKFTKFVCFLFGFGVMAVVKIWV